MKGIMVLYDKDKKKMKKYNMGHVKYSREKIMEKSVEKFNDDDPCIIHETYCVNYIVKELIDIIDTEYSEIIRSKIKIRDLDKRLRDYVEWDNYPKAVYVEYT